MRAVAPAVHGPGLYSLAHQSKVNTEGAAQGGILSTISSTTRSTSCSVTCSMQRVQARKEVLASLLSLC